MDRRVQLQKILESIPGLGFNPVTHRPAVYFQPPPSVKLVYPCIIYNLSRIDTKYANDKPYLNKKCYSVTIIDKDPDSKIPDTFYNMPLCRFERPYPADNLNHWIFSLFY